MTGGRRFFPPPARWAAPLLVLVFGLMATWFDYWLALDVNLGRDLAEVRGRAEGVARRLAVIGDGLLKRGDMKALRLNLTTMMDVPELLLAGVMDEHGRILADSEGAWSGVMAESTPLAVAAELARSSQGSLVHHGEEAKMVYAACPFPSGTSERGGWALITLDRRPAIAQARYDARVQLGWISGAMVLLSFSLWAVLHVVYAGRLAALAEGMRRWSITEDVESALPRGGDEVGALAAGFVEMTTKLRENEESRLRLEREVLSISEQERQRMGRDLHDDLGQRLTAASMAAQGMLEQLRKSSPTLVANGELVAEQLRDAITVTRAFSHGLAPVTLDAFGLMDALQEMTTTVSRSSKVRCVLECSQPVKLDDVEAGTHVFRIAQEAVNNALKHACPAEIRVGLERCGDEIILEVEDDGPGLSSPLPEKEGLGLRVMRYRARLLGGTFHVSTAAAGGTLVRVVIKLPEEKPNE